MVLPGGGRSKPGSSGRRQGALPGGGKQKPSSSGSGGSTFRPYCKPNRVHEARLRDGLTIRRVHGRMSRNNGKGKCDRFDY